jgi:23S rRNA (cytidine1920-2'-O)/16S rRNA (cytidine1409-2'-O)-methyltransferase
VSTKSRVDQLLVERGLAESREKAQRLIRAGLVHSQNERLDKPGRMIPADTELTVKGSDCPFVSRGGMKLAAALDFFAISPAGLVCIDLGASTGGFTDCLLQRGARLVHAIDVGRGQLHERLLRDERVKSREKTHIDKLEARQFCEPLQLAVADLSFISIRRVFPVLRRIMPGGTRALLLVKPQFEVGAKSLPRGGVVTDVAEHVRVLTEVKSAALAEGLALIGECESPILGGDGNKEFFICVEVPG